MYSFLIVTTWTAHAWASVKVRWNRAGASVYGRPCESSGAIGYMGDNLDERSWSFAELGNGTALGGLPRNAKVRVMDPNTGRKAWIRKRDIGGGGDSVQGYTRSFDLYYPLARWLVGASCTWTGVVEWRLPIRGW